MKFGIYFPIREVALRLGKHPQTIKRIAQRGELGPVWQIAGELTVSEDGILGFMDRHQADFSATAREFRRQALERQLRRPAERGPFTPGIPARNEGELRRKLSKPEPSESSESSEPQDAA